MKKDRIVKSLMVLMGWVCCSLIFGSGVMAQGIVNGTDAVGVAYRGHIQDYGDRPADEAWVDGDAQLGTTGESKRIEGFWIKLTGAENLPAGSGICYNVHVQNVGWLASTDLAQTGTWVANGDFAGSQGKSQRVEAIQIVLTGADGKVLPGYSVQYQVHIENYGWSQGWQADGAIAGTSGESKRLEAIQIKIVKTATEPVEDEPVVYDKAGINGPATGTQTIAGDVTVVADGVILQNLVIQGDLTISEAVGDGTVILNNVTVKGDTFVRGGGVNSIHINGGSYQNIVMEKTASGAVRIVATDADGLDVVIAEDATGETIILEGAFASVAVNAPNMTVTTQGDNTTIGKMTVGADAAGATLNLASGTTVTDLVLDGKTAAVKGQGTVTRAEVNADSAVFEKAPGSYAVESDVVIPPVFPSTDSGGGGGYTPPSKIALSISDPTVTLSRVYDGTRNAAVTATGTLTGVETDDDVQVTATASYDSKNVDTGGKTITVTYALTGTNASKYSAPVDKIITGGTITKIPLTAATPTVTKVYDGSLTSSAVTTGTGLVSGDTVTVRYTATYIDANVGTGKPVSLSYTLSGTDAGNYTTPAGDANATGEITPIQLTAKLTSITTEKVYNGNTDVNANYGDLKGVLSGETVGINMNAYYDSKDAGDRTITIEYPLNDTEVAKNYLAPVTVTKPGKITPIQLTATDAVVTTTKIYDGTTTAAITNAVTIGGILSTETAVCVIPVANYDNKKAETGKTITLTYVFTSGSDIEKANYTVPADKTVTTAGAVTQKDLGVITGNSVATTRYYDGTTVAKVITQGTFEGGCDGDDVLPKTTASFETAELGFAKKVTVTVTPEGTDMANYTGGNSVTVLTDGWIKQKPLSITDPMLTTSKEWDGNTSAGEVSLGTLSGVVEGEDVTVTAVATYQTSDIGINKNITVVYTLGGDDVDNYVKPINYTCQTAVIYQGFGVQKATYNGTSWSGFTDVTVTKTPTGYTIFEVDNAGIVYASASDGSIQKLSGSTWSAAYSGTLPSATFKLAGIDHATLDTAMGIDIDNGKVYYLNGTTWTDNGITITPPDGQFVGAYSTDDNTNFYLVFSKDNQLGQVNLCNIESIATLATSPTIPAGYHICGFNYTDGKLNCYICK